jgi:hypothetical protein
LLYQLLQLGDGLIAKFAWLQIFQSYSADSSASVVAGIAS